GLFSSLGLLAARPEFHDVVPCRLDARAVDPARVRALLDELRARLEPSLGADAEWVRTAELRYGGQSFEVEVEVDEAVDLARLVARFEDEHERLYGVRGEPGAPIEIRALRLAGLGRPAGARGGLLLAPNGSPGSGRRPAVFDGAAVDTPVRARAAIGAARPSGGTGRRRRSCWSARDGGGPGRPGDAAGRRQRARLDRGRDGDDDLPHRPLDRRPRRDGLLARDLRPARRDGRPGRDRP